MRPRGGQVLVAGGGIGGLAAALSVSRAGWDVRLLEQANNFSEAGAGIQLGPNVTRVLQSWGLTDALRDAAAFPESLRIRSAVTGKPLGQLALGESMTKRYGAPYATVHRADLHAMLMGALGATDTHLHTGRALESFTQTAQAVMVHPATGPAAEVDVLIGADGLWSTVREQLLGDGLPRATGHLAYRALSRQSALPQSLRSDDVTAWLGPRMHVVQYPVRGGEWLNMVAIIHGEMSPGADPWDHQANAADLRAALAQTCAALQEQVAAMQGWRLWPLYDRAPLQNAQQHVLGRVALLGDAAHPMRPYLAQGAGMAIEDADELGRVLGQALDRAIDVPTMLKRYALNRWQRNARVQARALRNGSVFHLDGPMRVARDISMKWLGDRILDMPWLYGYGQGARTT